MYSIEIGSSYWHKTWGIKVWVRAVDLHNVYLTECVNGGKYLAYLGELEEIE